MRWSFFSMKSYLKIVKIYITKKNLTRSDKMNAARVEGMKELHEIVDVHGASTTLAEAAAREDVFNSALDAEVGGHGLTLQGPVHLHTRGGVITSVAVPDFYPSRIPDLGSRIPDLGSRIQKQQ
jgi:hypothetical protein